MSFKHALSMASLLLLPLLSHSASAEHWCGEFDYPGGFATKAPMNISIAPNGTTATIHWVWDRKAHGCYNCCPETEPGLLVARNTSHLTLLGNGTVSQYYSFEAAFNAAGDGMVGNITNGGRTYGSFAAQKNGCPQIEQNCTPVPTPSPPPAPSPTPPGPPPLHAPVPVWPLPLRLNCTHTPHSANALPATELLASTVSVEITGAGAASPVTVAAAARYQLLLRKAGSASGRVTVVTVEVETADDTLDPTTNYNYSMFHDSSASGSASTSTTVTAAAASPFGVAYAFETLLQLASPRAQLDCSGGFTVQDVPVYQHRGLLLDTARRFFPLAVVLSTIDGMSIFKLNVLHLHLSDSTYLFRVESKTFPQLNRFSGRNCQLNSTCSFYTQEDIKSIVQYAHMRGIRVIPEFELLSHATSICGPLKSEGIVCCSGKWGMLQLGDDAAGNTTRILSALLTEMVPLFPDPVLHIGGDETQYEEPPSPCTVNASKSLQQKIMKQLVALGKTPMGWQEILLETGAAASFPEAIIEPWSKAGLWAQTDHPAVEALPSSLYLDKAATSAGYVHGGSYQPGVWFDITSGVLNTSNAHFLLGGEASMWGDQYTGTKHTPGHKSAGCMLPSPSSDALFAKSISGTIWPRAAVAAGSFWRWEESLSPQIQPELFASVVVAVNDILLARGVETCPCANATSNGCDSVQRCGVMYCNQKSTAA